MPDDRVTEEELAAWSALLNAHDPRKKLPGPLPLMKWVRTLIAEVRRLRAECDRQRERANEAQTTLDGHMSLCCNLKLAKELVAELGTEDAAAAVAEVKRLKGVEAIAEELRQSLCLVLHCPDCASTGLRDYVEDDGRVYHDRRCLCRIESEEVLEKANVALGKEARHE